MIISRYAFAAALSAAVLPVAAFEQTRESPVRIGGPVRAPKRTAYVAPPDMNGAKGGVILELLVDPEGDVVEVRKLRGADGLAASAMVAARKWKYEPLVQNGKPAWFLITATVTFPPASDQGAAAAPRLLIDGALVTLNPGALQITHAQLHTDNGNLDVTSELRRGDALSRIHFHEPVDRPAKASARASGTLTASVRMDDGRALTKRFLIEDDAFLRDEINPKIGYATDSRFAALLRGLRSR